ncbi:cyclin-like protein [Dipodascopsis tothii]|uniref:cyclin-like protein n=1 Tax=Dipodascopsis tothii TaxID=44089 RepID=UPI0034CF7BB9
MRTDDDLYRQSSQFRLWSFTRPELDEARRKVNARAVERLRRNSGDAGASIEFLTPEEELELVLFYCGKAQDVAGIYKLSSQIKATAISYLKKFYLRNSTMDYHPKNVMYTCLFLATKSENYFISIDNFSAMLPKVTSQDILELEFTVAQALSFTLSVHHPYQPLHGFFLDMQATLPGSVDTVGPAHDAARKLVSSSLFSDAALLFTPPQIALCAMDMVNSDILREYLEKKFVGKNEAMHKELLRIIDEIKPYMDNAVRKQSKDRVTAIDKKLYFCRNPDKLKKRKPEDTPEAADPGDAKRVKASAGPEDDIFGGPIR